ncbi:hypothetical protein EBZ39_01410 [bacterium]|nr:hypothetical protein [bacterium]
MKPQELQKRIELSPALRGLADQLSNELVFRADASAQFSPLLIVTILSMCVQLFIYCNPKKPEELKQNIRNIRTLRPARLFRLRRRSKVLWQNWCEENNYKSAVVNPIFAALLELGDSADDAALDELIAIAHSEQDPSAGDDA